MKRVGLFFAMAALLMTACADENPVGVDSGTQPSGSVVKDPPTPKMVPIVASF